MAYPICIDYGGSGVYYGCYEDHIGRRRRHWLDGVNPEASLHQEVHHA